MCLLMQAPHRLHCRHIEFLRLRACRCQRRWHAFCRGPSQASRHRSVGQPSGTRWHMLAMNDYFEARHAITWAQCYMLQEDYTCIQVADKGGRVLCGSHSGKIDLFSHQNLVDPVERLPPLSASVDSMACLGPRTLVIGARLTLILRH